MNLRFDFLETIVAEKGAVTTKEGWIRDEPILSCTGIFTYRQPDGSIRREYRPPSEVFHPDSLESLRGIPVTVGHPGMVTAQEHLGAIIGTVISAGRQDGKNLRAELVIHNPKAMGTAREISLAYSVHLDETPGEFEGERFDAIQRRPTYNHCAIVPKGRAGNSRLRMDANDAVMVGTVTGRDRFYDTPGWLGGAEQTIRHRQLAQHRADSRLQIYSAEQARCIMLRRTSR